MCFSPNVFSILNVPFVEWASHYDMAQHNYSPCFETSLDVSDLYFNCWSNDVFWGTSILLFSERGPWNIWTWLKETFHSKHLDFLQSCFLQDWKNLQSISGLIVVQVFARTKKSDILNIRTEELNKILPESTKLRISIIDQ